MRALVRRRRTEACAAGIPGWFGVLALVAFIAGWAPGVWAQAEGRKERSPLDPYTEGKAEVMAELGLRSFGPFRFGDGRTTEVIAREVGGVPLLWVETTHFQIGCSLEPLDWPEDSKAKKELQKELKELAQRLPNLPRRVKELDPWLVLHLYAARLEALFEEFVTRLHLEELVASDPYLGTGGPIAVLLCEKKSTFARFTATACRTPAQNSLRYYFNEPRGQLFFGIAFESLEGELHGDKGLHFAVVHSLTRVLADAVRGYYGTLPTWFSMGLGHWFARELVDDEILLYTTPRGEAGREKGDADFAVKVRKRVSNGIFPPWAEMESWRDPFSLRFSDHMVAWSRVDYFLTADGGARATEFLLGASEPVPWAEADRDEKRAALAHGALLDLAGGDLGALDEAWVDWVLDRYPKR